MGLETNKYALDCRLKLESDPYLLNGNSNNVVVLDNSSDDNKRRHDK